MSTSPGRLRLVVPDHLDGERLDRVLGELAELTRAHAQRLIREDRVRLDERARKASYPVPAGATLEAEIPAPPPVGVEAEDIPLAIEETRRAREELGLCGVMLRSAAPHQTFFHPFPDAGHRVGIRHARQERVPTAGL